ncbi:unnamed protein product [Caenorhabditis angaria]|uniref:Globin family profile domain-containing protein n=1 Tax=Caenorhabditis angaria TaxID=860376 RepID=A0A9P1N986_9PELO|nr:unnamed protein product [Caenorhabditis angaria]
MMRIKEAIQRKKLIHEMNEEWKDIDYDLVPGMSTSQPNRCPASPSIRKSYGSFRSMQNEEFETPETRLHNFVFYLSGKLSDLQKRALKITWRRLSEAPKTSGRGTLHIMEKVLTKLCDQSPGVTAIFYKSAFLSCIEDRKCGRRQQASIATIRDHAHILITLIDDILHIMFEGPLQVVKYDPVTIGEVHSRLAPLGFDRAIWHVFGECFAEVMFMQECIRAYPHAPSAWSLLAVALTDRIFSSSKLSLSKSRNEPFPLHESTSSTVQSAPPVPPPRKTANMRCPFFSSTINPTPACCPHKRALPTPQPLQNRFSLDLSEISTSSTNNDDDDVFFSARSHFENDQPAPPIPPPPVVPQRRLPMLMMTTSVCDERTFYDNHHRKYSIHESRPRRSRSVHHNAQFLRSKSEARLRLQRANRDPSYV